MTSNTKLVQLDHNMDNKQTLRTPAPRRGIPCYMLYKIIVQNFLLPAHRRDQITDDKGDTCKLQHMSLVSRLTSLPGLWCSCRTLYPATSTNARPKSTKMLDTSDMPQYQRYCARLSFSGQDPLRLCENTPIQTATASLTGPVFTVMEGTGSTANPPAMIQYSLDRSPRGLS